MRKFLTTILLIAFNFSAFAQIDTISYEGTTVWHKTYVFANCGGNIEDCLVWRLVAKFDIQNPKTGEIDEYVLINDDSYKFIETLPYLYQNDSLDYHENKRIFVDLIRSQHPKLEKILIEKYGNSHKIYFMGEADIHGENFSRDWLFVLSDGTSQVQIIDLKTNRVIEKIKIE